MTAKTRLLLPVLCALLIALASCSNRSAPPASADQWLSWYQQWRDTPYRYGGTSTRGVDCSALVQDAYRSIYRIKIPRTTGEQRRQGKRVRFNQLQVGDLLFFKPAGTPNHVGIFVGDNRFVHASSSKGVIISALDRTYWLPRLAEARRILN